MRHFWQHVRKTPTCWVWTGPQNGDGYGLFTLTSLRRQVLAHRFAWELLRGPIPPRLQVLHTCPGGDNRLCVNALSHLRPGTNQENVRDASERGTRAIQLLPCDVQAIRARLAQGTLQAVLAEEFGVSQMTISHVSRRVTWNWL